MNDSVLEMAPYFRDSNFLCVGCCREEVEGSGKCVQVWSNDDKCFFCVEEALLQPSVSL